MSGKNGLAVVAAVVLGGCAPIAEPRYPTDVATAVARQPMRRMESANLIVYYPEGRQSEADRFQRWVGGCIRNLQARARIDSVTSRRKPFVVLTNRPINNAFVAPMVSGLETASAVTGYSTFDSLLSIGTPPDPALFGCHEMVHWVQLMQVGGFWGGVDWLWGDVLSPQMGLDPWFHEGLATYYESVLQTFVGRMTSPFWEGAFHAGVAGRRLNGGDLSHANRAFLFGNHYLVGSRFIAFLAWRYGEERLWRLVEIQGRSFFFPLWVNLRFWQVYDRTLSELIDEFADDVAGRYPVMQRPRGQASVRQLGYAAEYAVARNGTEAVVLADFDQPTRLEVRAPDGRLLVRRSLQDVLLPRRIVSASPANVSGLSLTADGRAVYFTIVDEGVTFPRVRLVRHDVARDKLEILVDDLGGPGGAVSEDGRAFFFVRAHGDRHELCELDLTSKQVRTIAPAASGVFFGSPRPSPDGRRLVATMVERNMVRVVVLDRATGQVQGAPIAMPGPSVDPWFADDRRVLFASESHRRFQVFVHDTGTGSTGQVTAAPYLAIGARPAGRGKLRFLNREGWSWTLDETTLPPAPPLAPPPAPAPPSEPVPAPETAAAVEGAEAAVEHDRPAESAATIAQTSGPAAAVTAQITAAPPPWTPPSPVLSDQKYSVFERLFVPQLRGPHVTFMPESGQTLLGLMVAGGDRLSRHRWALAGYIQTSATDEQAEARLSGSVGYANTQLAPLTLRLTASDFAWVDRFDDPMVIKGIYYDRRERELELSVELPFFSHVASLSAHAGDRRQSGHPDPLEPARRRLSGATAELLLHSAVSTPYVTRHLLTLALSGSVFPGGLSSAGYTFGDIGAGVWLRLPVPPLRRLLLALKLRGRALPGTPAGSGLLEVGGGGSGILFSEASEISPVLVGDEVLDRRLQRFFEPLKGFEDLTLFVDKVAISEARLEYPLIIDRGFASTLGLLPSLFFRQIDLEAFGSAAWAPPALPLPLPPGTTDTWHGAAGAALTLRTVFLVPFGLRYQVARRLTDDRAWVHLVSVGL